ncbi:MAG: hypothetical protein E6845_18875 [Clostridium sp.]|uniref:hypothetical protein n=1 Tax=Clostridium sp. TaxID=1506 RepID=UPI00290210B7|nr:hypothetical protein [Clostridium sp.]MDU1605022.1 hypothetical protein [Clostridium sp.]
MAESTASEAAPENTSETAEQATTPLQQEPAPTTVKTESAPTPEPAPTPKTEHAPTPEPAPTEITGEAIIQALTKALGMDETKTPTIEEVTAQYAAEKTGRETAQRLLDVYKAANGIADPDMLTDSKRFTDSLETINTSDQTVLADHIKQFIADNPRFALTQPSGSSTVDPSNTGTQTTTVEEFRKMNGQQRNALYQSNPDLYEQLRATA